MPTDTDVSRGLEHAATKAPPRPQFLNADAGLLSPVTVGADAVVSDAAVARQLIAAEVGLARAWGAVGVAPPQAVAEITNRFDPDQNLAETVNLETLTLAAVAGGNPVIALVGLLRSQLSPESRRWLHCGATSQDIMDTGLMLVAHVAAGEVCGNLREIEAALKDFAVAGRDEVAVARTLTQHAVPTTVGLRAANWRQGVSRAALKLERVRAELPVQLGGAGGTLASFTEVGGIAVASELPRAFADEVGLDAPLLPWHTSRWPVTELGDVLVQAIDALGVIAANVATLGRTEIGEVSELAGGGSSAMPQKSNPVGSVLIRSAAIRAPHLLASLHSSAALAVDERPDGAWHAEWPVLRELMRLALGASQTALQLIQGLRVDRIAVSRNLQLTGGLIVAERINLVLGPVLGEERIKAVVANATGGGDLAELLKIELERAGREDVNVEELLNAAHYTGLAAPIVDSLTRRPKAAGNDEDH